MSSMKNTQVLVYKKKTRASLNGIRRTVACGKTGRLKMFQMKRLKHTKQAHVGKANPSSSSAPSARIIIVLHLERWLTLPF